MIYDLCEVLIIIDTSNNLDVNDLSEPSDLLQASEN